MRKERNRRLAGVLAVLLLLCGLLAGCIPGSAGEGGQEAGENTAQHASFWADGGEATLRVLSGSENRELEPIIQECVRETGINIVMEYKGSVDIMRELEAGAETYDAVWPANSLWISLGDKSHLVKHVQSKPGGGTGIYRPGGFGGRDPGGDHDREAVFLYDQRYSV